MVVQDPGDVSGPRCHRRAQAKERPLPQTAMPHQDLGARGPPDRAQELPVDQQGDQVGYRPNRRGRTVSEVAAELDLDWNTANDAVTTHGTALLATIAW